jgi:hypothetical protein
MHSAVPASHSGQHSRDATPGHRDECGVDHRHACDHCFVVHRRRRHRRQCRRMAKGKATERRANRRKNQGQCKRWKSTSLRGSAAAMTCNRNGEQREEASDPPTGNEPVIAGQRCTPQSSKQCAGSAESEPNDTRDSQRSNPSAATPFGPECDHSGANSQTKRRPRTNQSRDLDALQSLSHKRVEGHSCVRCRQVRVSGYALRLTNPGETDAAQGQHQRHTQCFSRHRVAGQAPEQSNHKKEHRRDHGCSLDEQIVG